MKKKIAVFGVKTVPYTGGIEYVIENTLPKCNHEKFEFIVYVRKKYYNENNSLPYLKIIPLPHLNNKNLEAPSHTFLSVLHALFIEKCDVFYFNAVVLGLFTIIPKLFFKKVVLLTHGQDWKREKWGKIAKIIIQISTYLSAKIPDKTLCVGEADRDFFLQRYGKNFEILQNGVSEINFNNSNEYLKKYDIEKQQYLLFMARLVPEKGPQLLVDAYLKIPKKYREKFKLVIAGDTNYYDDYYINLKKYSFNDIIFTGFVDSDEKYTLLSNALCFIQPSSIEGMSIGILESMYFGLPTIVSDIPENTAITKNFGLKFNTGNVESLESIIIYFIENREKYLLRRAEVKNYVEKNYSWTLTIDKLNRVFEEI